MKSILAIPLFIISSFAFGQSQTLRVLFLGNSYTSVNNLPHLISDVASSTGDSLIYDSYTIGGYTLDQHFADTNSTNKIQSDGWDYVVLQDQSEVPALPDYSGYGANSLCYLIREYNPCARAMFYMTWGRQNGDTFNCSAWPPVCTYEGMDSLLYLSYMEMGSVNHAEVSPVGVVWKYIRENYPAIGLYQSDESHPSFSGSYLAACCFYASLFKRNPTFINYNYVLDSTDAANIRNAAKTIIYDSLSNWYFENNLPVADFHYIVGAGINEVNFINESMDAEMYQWDFGDGYFSSEKNPVHNYLSDGSYTITLTASSCDRSQIYQSTHQLHINFCPFNPSVFPDTLVICPNANDTLWTQLYDSYQWFNALGDTMFNETNQYLPLSGGGSYSVLATQNGCPEMSSQVTVNLFHSLQIFYVDITGNLMQQDTACMGDTVKLILIPNKPPYPNDNNVQWFKDGVPILSSNNDTLIVTSTGDYEVSLYDSTYCPGSVIYAGTPLSLAFINCNLMISENDNQSPVIVYPNPSDDFTIKINPGLAGTNYTIIDIVGRILSKGKFEKEINNLKMSDLKSGVYILKLEQKNEQAIKLVKK